MSRKLYVIISAGRSPDEAEPVAASSNPEVARATLEAILREMEFPAEGPLGSMDRDRLSRLVLEAEEEAPGG